jgi:hypothetical protein
VRVSTVPKEAVKHVWSDVEELLKKSVADTSRGKIDLIDILNGILTDVYVLWVVLDDEDKMIAAITTRIATYPRRKSMVLDFVGGSKLNEWKDLVINTISEFAKKNDCRHLEGFGRKGWIRALRGNGFYPEYIAYRMEL